MDEEIDYHGEVEVVHLLSLLRDDVGWDTLREKCRVPLTGLKIAPYYGCTLQRPKDVGIEPPGRFEIMSQLIDALGATAVDFPAADLCCGSYQILGNPDAAGTAIATILGWAERAGAEALALSCPLCEFNLGKNQKRLLEKEIIPKPVPTFYFSQLLAIALGLSPEHCHFDLNEKDATELLKSKGLI